MNRNLSEEQQQLVDLLIMELMKRCQVSAVKAHDMMEDTTFYTLLEKHTQHLFHQSLDDLIEWIVPKNE